MNWLLHKNRPSNVRSNSARRARTRRAALEPLEDRRLLSATVTELNVGRASYSGAELNETQSGVGYVYQVDPEGYAGSVLTLDHNFIGDAAIEATGNLTIVISGSCSITVAPDDDAIWIRGDLKLDAQTGAATDAISVTGGLRVDGALTVEGVDATTGAVGPDSPVVLFNGTTRATNYLATEAQLKAAFKAIESGTDAKPNKYAFVVTQDMSVKIGENRIGENKINALVVPKQAEVTMTATGARTITRTDNSSAFFWVYGRENTKTPLDDSNTTVDRSAVLNLGLSGGSGTNSLTFDGAEIANAGADGYSLIHVSGTLNMYDSITLRNCWTSKAHSTSGDSVPGGGAMIVSGVAGWMYDNPTQYETLKKYVGVANIYGGQIINCRAPQGDGGAIDCYGELNMAGGTISDCYAKAEGGAVRDRGRFVMSGGEITNCSCGYIAKTLDENGQYVSAKTTLADAVSEFTQGSDYGKGGGIHVSSIGYLQITGDSAKISHSRATTYGGGIYVGGSGTATALIEGGTLYENEAFYGGGIATNSTLVLDGELLIRLNEAYLRGPDGEYYSVEKDLDGAGATVGYVFSKIDPKLPRDEAQLAATSGLGDAIYSFTLSSSTNPPQILIGGAAKVDSSNAVYFGALNYTGKATTKTGETFAYEGQPVVPVYVFSPLTCDGAAMLISTDGDSGSYSKDRIGNDNRLQLSSMPMARFANGLDAQASKFAISSGVWQLNQTNPASTETQNGGSFTKSTHAGYVKYSSYMNGTMEGIDAKYYENAKTTDANAIPAGESQYLALYAIQDSVMYDCRINDLCFVTLDNCLDFIERHSSNVGEGTLTSLGLLDYGSAATDGSITVYMMRNSTIGYSHNLYCDNLTITIVAETDPSVCAASMEYQYGWKHNGNVATSGALADDATNGAESNDPTVEENGSDGNKPALPPARTLLQSDLDKIVEGDLDSLRKSDASPTAYMLEQYDAMLLYAAFLKFGQRANDADLLGKTEAELLAMFRKIDITAKHYRTRIPTIDAKNVVAGAMADGETYRFDVADGNISSATWDKVKDWNGATVYAKLKDGVYYIQPQVDYAGNYEIVADATAKTITILDALAPGGSLKYTASTKRAATTDGSWTNTVDGHKIVTYGTKTLQPDGTYTGTITKITMDGEEVPESDYTYKFNDTGTVLNFVVSITLRSSKTFAVSVGTNNLEFNDVQYAVVVNDDYSIASSAATSRSNYRCEIDGNAIVGKFYSGLATFDPTKKELRLYDVVVDCPLSEPWSATETATIVIRDTFECYPSLYASSRNDSATPDPGAWRDANGERVLDKSVKDYAAIAVGGANTEVVIGSGAYFDGYYRYTTPPLFAVEMGSTLTMQPGSEIRNVRDRTTSATGASFQFMGAGAIVVYNGSFVMNGGSITGCAGYHAGAVYVGVNGSMTMNGGQIVDCVGAEVNADGDVVRETGAGAIYSMGKLVLNGGSILDNNGYWGGIYSGFGAALEISSVKMANNQNAKNANAALPSAYASDGRDAKRGDISIFHGGDSMTITSDKAESISIDGLVYLAMNTERDAQLGLKTYDSMITVKTTVANFLKAGTTLAVDSYDLVSFARLVAVDADADGEFGSAKDLEIAAALASNKTFSHIARDLSVETTFDEKALTRTSSPYLIFDLNRIYYVNETTEVGPSGAAGGSSQVDKELFGTSGETGQKNFESPIYNAPNGKIYYVYQNGADYVLEELVADGDGVRTKSWRGTYYSDVLGQTLENVEFTYKKVGDGAASVAIDFYRAVAGSTTVYQDATHSFQRYDADTMAVHASMKIQTEATGDHPGMTIEEFREELDSHETDQGKRFTPTLYTCGFSVFNSDGTVTLTIFNEDAELTADGSLVGANGDRQITIPAGISEYADPETGLVYHVRRKANGDDADAVVLYKNGRTYSYEYRSYGKTPTVSPILSIVDDDGVDYNFRATLYDGLIVKRAGEDAFDLVDQSGAIPRSFERVADAKIATDVPSDLAQEFAANGRYDGKNYALYRAVGETSGATYLVVKTTQTEGTGDAAKTTVVEADHWRYVYESNKFGDAELVSRRDAETVYDATNNVYVVLNTTSYNYGMKTLCHFDLTYSNPAAPTMNDYAACVFTLTEAKGVVYTETFEVLPKKVDGVDEPIIYDGVPYLAMTKSERSYGEKDGTGVGQSGYVYTLNYDDATQPKKQTGGQCVYNRIYITDVLYVAVENPIEKLVDADGNQVVVNDVENIDVSKSSTQTKTATACKDQNGDVFKRDYKTTNEQGETETVGYYFVGWNTAKDGSGTWIYPNSSTMNVAALTKGQNVLYAQWAANIVNTTDDEFELEFNENTGVYSSVNAWLSLREAIYIATYNATQTDARYLEQNAAMVEAAGGVAFETDPSKWAQSGDEGWSVEVDGETAYCFPETVDFQLTRGALTISSGLTLDGLEIIGSGKTRRDFDPTAAETTVRLTSAPDENFVPTGADRLVTFAANGVDDSKILNVAFDKTTQKYVVQSTYALSKPTSADRPILWNRVDFYDGGAYFGTKKINGGGLYVRGDVYARVENAEFVDCQGWFGGAVSNLGNLTLANVAIYTTELKGNVLAFDANGNVAVESSEWTAEKTNAHNGGGIYNNGTLALENVSVTGTSVANLGGGIANMGTLTATVATIEACSARGSGDQVGGYGGAVANQGVAKMLLATFKNNYASENGGAWTNIYVAPAAGATPTNATIARSVFDGNVAAYHGGAIFNGATIRVEGTAFVENKAAAGSGGAFYNTWYGEDGAPEREIRGEDPHPGETAVGVATINGYEDENGELVYTTFQQNSAANYGGAIYDFGKQFDAEGDDFVSLKISHATFGRDEFANGAGKRGASLATAKSDLSKVFFGNVTYNPDNIFFITVDLGETSATTNKPNANGAAASEAVLDADANAPCAPGSFGALLRQKLGFRVASVRVAANGSEWFDVDLNGSLVDSQVPLKSGQNALWLAVVDENGAYSGAFPAKLFVVDADPTIEIGARSFGDSRIAAISANVVGDVPIANWTIDWGDGAQTVVNETSFAENFAHYYAAPGEYAIAVKVVDANGFGSATVYSALTWRVDASDGETSNATVETVVANAENASRDYVANDLLYVDAEPALAQAVERAAAANVDAVFGAFSENFDDETDDGGEFAPVAESLASAANFDESDASDAFAPTLESRAARRRSVFRRLDDSRFDLESLDAIFDDRLSIENG